MTQKDDDKVVVTESTTTSTTSSASADPVEAFLTEQGVSPEQIIAIRALGAESVDDLASLTEADLTGGKVMMLPLRARKLLGVLSPKAVHTATVAPMQMQNFDALPTLPDDASWLMSLKVGGVLKFNPTTVIGAVSAALADRVGLYELPKRIVTAMELNAESLEEPVGSDFFEMQRALTERSYADIFAAIPGATGRYATEARKRQLLTRMEQNLWPALIGFNEVVSGWIDAWQKGMANPAMMMGAIAAMAGGGGGAMPPGMMAPPPTDGLRDSAEAVITAINRIFAGTGIPVAMALAYDAQQIRKALENPALPAQVGALNRDQMLKQLGVAVASDYPRLESNVKRFALGVIELPNVTAGQAELTYITALFQLGAAIPWKQLGSAVPGVAAVTGIGGRRRTTSESL